MAGSVAATASAAAALTLDGCKSTSASEELLEEVASQFPAAQVEYLNVDPDLVAPHTDMILTDSEEYLYHTKTFDLPLGSLVYQSSDTHALIVAPGASSKSLIQLGFAELEGGTFTPCLGQALGFKEDYVIYDARASATAIIWVECNMVHGLWRVYAAPVEQGLASEEAMQQAQLLDEGEGTYSPPRLAAAEKKAYWTVMPDPHGPASSEDSYLKSVEFTNVKASRNAVVKVVYTSHGRLITNPVVSGDVLTFVPRVDTDGVYYQLTTLDIRSDAVKNIAILPPSVRVSDAVWLKNGFAFGIEANYEHAAGISLFGSYQQLGNGRFLYINKMPASAVVEMNRLTYVKSTKNVLALDTDRRAVAIVDTPLDCVTYGDILAGAGKQNRLVLYTTVQSRIGQDRGICRVRVLDHL